MSWWKMISRAWMLLTGVFVLASCAGGGWPGQYGADPTAYDFPVVQKRWAAASQVPLGSAQDVAGITAALKKAHADTVVREIRWLSATEVMAVCVRGGGVILGEESFYGALKRSGDHWRVVAWYDGSAT
jgi:hypothetical protein